MTKSQIFKAAHKLAKTFQGNYASRLAYSLRRVYRAIKEDSKKDRLIKLADSVINWNTKGESPRLAFVITELGKDAEIVKRDVLNMTDEEVAKDYDSIRNHLKDLSFLMSGRAMHHSKRFNQQ
jgi:hypothetical protein